MSAAELLQWMKNGKQAGKDFVLVDLRRNAHEVCVFHIGQSSLTDVVQGGTIHGSINLPAQSLYPSIPVVFAMLKAGNIHKIIWYCGK